MEINNEACEISFELETSIKISAGGSLIDAKTIKFRQPNRKTGPFFWKLASMFNSAVQRTTTKFFETMDDYDKGKAQSQAEESKKNTEVIAMDSLQNITVEKFEEELGFLNEMIIPTMEFDYEKSEKLFTKVLMGGKSISEICFLGGQGLTETHLDKIGYQDFKKMMVIYISFFAKPVKSGRKKDSEMQSESPISAMEV